MLRPPSPLWKTCFTRVPSWTLSLVASLHCKARTATPRQPRRAPLQENNLNLFDLLLDETYPWETLHDEHKVLAINLLARLIANATLRHNEEKDHE
jgi:hypothetical protein